MKSGAPIFYLIIAGVIAIIVSNITNIQYIGFAGFGIFGIAVLYGYIFIQGVKGELSSKEIFVGPITRDTFHTEKTALVIRKAVRMKYDKKADFSNDDKLRSIVADVNNQINEQIKPLRQFLQDRTGNDTEEESEDESDEKSKSKKKKDKKDVVDAEFVKEDDPVALPEEITEPEKELNDKEPVAAKDVEVEKTSEKKKKATKKEKKEAQKKMLEKILKRREADKEEEMPIYITLEQFKEFVDSGFEIYYCELERPFVWDDMTSYFESFLLLTRSLWNKEFPKDELKTDDIVGFDITIRGSYVWLVQIGNAQPDVPILKVGYSVNYAYEEAADAMEQAAARDKMVDALVRYCSTLRAQNDRIEEESQVFADDAEYWEVVAKRNHQKYKMALDRGAMEDNRETVQVESPAKNWIIGILIVGLIAMAFFLK